MTRLWTNEVFGDPWIIRYPLRFPPRIFCCSMISLKRPSIFLALAFSLLTAVAFAQIGDNADKPGAPQVPLVPADKIPPATALSPEDALKSFTLQPGFKLEIAAAEPLVQDPVAMTFGPDGRMWVVEMRGFMADLDGKGEDVRPTVVPRYVKRPVLASSLSRVDVGVQDSVLLMKWSGDDSPGRCDDDGVTGVDPPVLRAEHGRA